MAGKIVVEAENGDAAPSHLFVLWERAYEARLYRGQEEIIERAKTPEAAEALLVKRWTDTEIQIEVRGDLIIVTQPVLSPSSPSQNISRTLFSSAAPILMTMC